MSRKEKKRLRAAFRQIDTSNKGYVTKDEIVKYLIKTNDLSEQVAEKRATEMMKIMDRKHQGHISVKSFVRSKKLSFIQDQFSNDESVNSKILEVFDPTESGYIDTSKIATALRETTSREDSELIVNRLDPDNTGKVSNDLFIQMASTHTTPRSSIVGSPTPPVTDDTILSPPDTLGSMNASTSQFGIAWSSLPIHEHEDQELPSPPYQAQSASTSANKKIPKMGASGSGSSGSNSSKTHKITNSGKEYADYAEYTNFKFPNGAS